MSVVRWKAWEAWGDWTTDREERRWEPERERWEYPLTLGDRARNPETQPRV